MNLESLRQRKIDIEQALTNTANQYQSLVGNKLECEYWIGELEKAEKDAKQEDEVIVE